MLDEFYILNLVPCNPEDAEIEWPGYLLQCDKASLSFSPEFMVVNRNFINLGKSSGWNDIRNTLIIAEVGASFQRS